MTSTGGPANAYTFTGQQRDTRTGLYYFRARYYDPRSGRFISQDPIQSIDPYVYAANDPLDFVDPTGAQAFVERAEIDAGRLETEEAIRELAWQLCGPLLGAVLGLGLGPNAMGSAGEDYVSSKFLGNLGKNTDLLDPSGVRRIPDFIKNGFIEVKNVGRLSLTRQINDLLHLLPNGQQLTLYVRGGTKLSGPLLDAIRKSGLIKVFRCLPG
jgi:RHS repeat-associated protein